MKKIAVVGAGLVGSLQAIFMAKKGYQVEVFERRADMRKQRMSAGRSINLALSNRGWKALKAVGVDHEISKMAIPMYGRIMHDIEGNTTYQSYGKEEEAIYSVSRGGLNSTLMDLAESFENVTFKFSHRCHDIDLDANTMTFVDENDAEHAHHFDHIFATDGAFSAIRSRMQKNDRFNFQQYYLDHGYKELSIPPSKDGKHQIEKNALHIWPRGKFMLIALANEDGSFTCTLFFPFEGEESFSTIKTDEEINSFFKKTFPDALELMPNLLEDYNANPSASLVTIRCAPWNYKENVLLMGDASHAIVPFYGQGMNSGFEDCSVFDEIFESNERNWTAAFEEFSTNRKADADAISNLALQNYIEMRDLVADPSFLLRKKIEQKIFEKHPDKWMPLYSQVTFSHIPYAKALAAGDLQKGIMDQIMRKDNIEEIWDSEDIEKEIIHLASNA